MVKLMEENINHPTEDRPVRKTPAGEFIIHTTPMLT